MTMYPPTRKRSEHDMPHLGTQELVIILIIVLLLFGAKRLPELGKSLAQGIKEFRKSSKTIMEDDDDDSAKKPEKDSAA